MFRKDDDLHGSTQEQSQSIRDVLMKWWEVHNHKIAYKLLYMAQHGDKNERYKAATTLGSLTHLEGKLNACQP